MAAVSAYGRVLYCQGLEQGAQECADFLLALDPADRLNLESSIMERRSSPGLGHP